jgi:transcriptional regulator with XRE-family HTH domain
MYYIHEVKTDMTNEFTEELSIHMIKKGKITQTEFAKNLGCSASFMSNVMTGKTSPDIPFIIKCRDFFNLSDNETLELFKKAFSSSNTIPLDTSYFGKDIKKILGSIVAILLLFPKTNPDIAIEIRAKIGYLQSKIEKRINECHDELLALNQMVSLDRLDKKTDIV